MKHTIIIELLDTQQLIEISAGTTIGELLKDEGIWKASKTASPEAPLLALVDNRPTALATPLYETCTVQSLSYQSSLGSRTYVSTLALLLFKVLDEMGYPHAAIEHALSNGYYGVLDRIKTIPTEDFLQQVEARMKELIRQDLPILQRRWQSQRALEYFLDRGQVSIADIIEGQERHYTNLVELEGYMDLMLDPPLPTTGMIWDFALMPLQEGFLLRVPNRFGHRGLKPLVFQPKQFAALESHLALMEMIQMTDLPQLNRAIHTARCGDIIALSEAMQEKIIANIAQEIAEKHREGVRMVLLSGPSSSGKTTTAKRLSTQLMTNMIMPHAISLDDYYINRKDTPLDEQGRPDYESLYALDLPKLKEDVTSLMAGKEVALPTYDFIAGERVYHDWKRMKLEPNGILIMEGIHALNPELLEGVPSTALYKIYVSALTPLSLNNHIWIRSSDNRLLRRMVRDMKFRGTSAEETILRWGEVRRGEEKWIFPYQEYADVMFNSALLYEIPALKSQARAALMGVSEVSPAYPTAYRLLRFLELFEEIDTKEISRISLLREFLGGGLQQ